MIEFVPENKMLKIVIPIENIDELNQYQKAILRILERIELNNCEPQLKEDLKSVYKLLSHMLIDKSFIEDHHELFGEFSKDVLVLR